MFLIGIHDFFNIMRISVKTGINFLFYAIVAVVCVSCATLEPGSAESYQRKSVYLAGIHGTQKPVVDGKTAQGQDVKPDKVYAAPYKERLNTDSAIIPADKKSSKSFFEKYFGSNNDGFLKKRQNSYDEYYRAYDELAYTREIDETYTITVTIRVVGDYSKYPYSQFAKQKRYGYYDPATNTIWVLGKKLNGQVIANEFALGHEMTHSLNFSYGSIADPDRFAELTE